QILRHVAVVGQKLLGVFGQTIATVAEARVVIVRTNARIKTNTINDLLAVQAMGGRIGVEFVEIRHAHRQIGVGEKLDGFSLGLIAKKDRYVLFYGALFKQIRKDLSTL